MCVPAAGTSATSGQSPALAANRSAAKLWLTRIARSANNTAFPHQTLL
jgi:hypothetical protein